MDESYIQGKKEPLKGRHVLLSKEGTTEKSVYA